MVTPEDLKEALRLQIFRTLQIAFRWPDGNFRFSQEGQIEYDADHMAPVPTESVLMEAAQIHDELPRLKEKIRSNDIVFRRAPGREALQPRLGGGAAAPEGRAARLARRAGDLAMDRRHAGPSRRFSRARSSRTSTS